MKTIPKVCESVILEELQYKNTTVFDEVDKSSKVLMHAATKKDEVTVPNDTFHSYLTHMSQTSDDEIANAINSTTLKYDVFSTSNYSNIHR